MTPDRKWFHLNGNRHFSRKATFDGEYDDNMPMSIGVTDREGRSCVYKPITVEGRVVDSKGFNLERLPESSKGRARLS